MPIIIIEYLQQHRIKLCVNFVLITIILYRVVNYAMFLTVPVIIMLAISLTIYD